MAKQIITDEELKLKQQARRRLIGAIVLTILVVTLLPMLLDSEPPAPTRDIDLQIPNKDKAGEFVPQMVLPPTNANNGASQPASAPVIAPLLDTKPLVEPASSKVTTKANSKTEATAVSDKAPSDQKAVTVAKPQKPDSKPKTVAKAHAGFIVQVGAFANADGAKKLQDTLHKQGYTSYTEKAGDKIRVRIGDFSTHAEAEKIRRKLEIQGYQPDVINLN